MTSTPFEDFLFEETSIRVAEEMGPNALDADRRHDQLMDDEMWVAKYGPPGSGRRACRLPTMP